MTRILLHLDDWKKFAELMAFYLTGYNNALRQHWELVVHMLHSVPCMFDFRYQVFASFPPSPLPHLCLTSPLSTPSP